MKVGEVMTRSPLTVARGDDAGSVAGVMRDQKIRHAPVTDSDGELLGVLSDRDLLSASALVVADGDESTTAGEALRTIKVDEIYTRSPDTIDEDAPL